MNLRNTWQEIWNQKKSGDGEASLLSRLIAADGFGSPFGRLKDERHWLDYVENAARRLGIGPQDSVYDVGCGAGAFLYPFYSKGHRVGGMDYAPNLISIARSAMPLAQLSIGDAATINTEGKYSVVVSNGVFLYFPDYKYAAGVLRRMAEMAEKSIGVFDVPDLAKKKAAIAERIRTLGKAQYKEKYQGLDHLYFSREWFGETLGRGFNTVVLDQDMDGYSNSRYRFNVYFQRA
jgi:SAM-dependent methyltransferase